MPRTSTSAMLDDEVSFNKNGTIKLVVSGKTFRLRRPTIGELRTFVELWNERNAEQVEYATERRAEVDAYNDAMARWNEDGSNEDDKPDDLPEIRNWVTETVAWYRRVINDLNVDSSTLSDDDDDMPTWMGGPEAGREWLGDDGWKGTPWAAGARPSEQRAAATQNQLAQMGSVMDRLSPLLPLIEQLAKKAQDEEAAQVQPSTS